MKIKKLEAVILTLTATCGAAAGAAIALSVAYLVLALGSAVLAPRAFGQTSPAVQLEGAIAREQVDGDLAAAIVVYRKIADQASAPRDVRAKALLHLAGCYEKLGRQAAQVYEQIVRDFGDQPTAAQARARLAALQESSRPATPVTMSLRKIEHTALGSFGPGDTDGHRAVYWDDASGTLNIGDLAGLTRRVIYTGKPPEKPGWIPSKDFSLVLLLFQRANRLAIVKSDGSGYREIFHGEPQEPVLGGSWASANWSWDNRRIVVPGGGSLWVIDVADRTRREIAKKNREGGRFEKAAFSRDGRFLAYDTVPNDSAKDQTARTFVVPVEGGEPRLIFEDQPGENFHFLDWTLDSRYLAIASARSGRTALYLQPVQDGQPGGQPVLIRRGDYNRGSVTAEGSLVFESASAGGLAEVHLGALDGAGHAGNWQKLDLRGEGRFNPSPTFSPDGNQMAYTAAIGDGFVPSSGIVYVRDLSTGKEHEVYRGTAGVLCRWAAQHPKLFCSEVSPRKSNLFAVPVASGEVEKLGSFASLAFIRQTSHDDQAFYVDRVENTTPSTATSLRFDIQSRRETILETYQDTTPADDDVDVIPSPDDRWLFRLDDSGIAIRPISGGDWKHLVKAIGEQAQFTPDSSAILFHGADAAGRRGLYRVPISGGQPQRLGDFPSSHLGGGLEISADGRKILTVSMPRIMYNETWVLDNFLPAPPKR